MRIWGQYWSRSAFLICGSILLQSCDSGGATSSQNTDSNPVSPATSSSAELHPAEQAYSSSAARAASLYSGKTAPASLDIKNASKIFLTMSAGAFPKRDKVTNSTEHPSQWVGFQWSDLRELPLLPIERSVVIRTLDSGRVNCGTDPHSGYADISVNELDADGNPYIGSSSERWRYYQLTIKYMNCQPSTAKPLYNGLVNVYTTEQKDISHVYRRQSMVSYEGLKLSNGSETFQIDGASIWPNVNGCGPDGRLGSTLHIQELGSGQSLLLDKLQMLWEETDPDKEFCYKHDNPLTVVGIAKFSDIGSVEFSLPETFSTPDYDQTIFGDLNFRAGESEASSSIRLHPAMEDAPGYERFIYRVAELTIIDNQTNQKQQLSHLESAFLSGSMVDLNDDDGDGMSNSWEVIYGFDPLFIDEADEDADGDGVTNVVEHLTLGLPDRKDIKGLPSDDSVSVSTSVFSNAAGRRVALTPSISRTGRYWDEETRSDLFVLEVDFIQGEWVDVPDYCIAVTPLRIECSELEINRNRYRKLYFWLADSVVGTAEVELRISMDTYGYDYWPENNEVVTQLSF